MFIYRRDQSLIHILRCFEQAGRISAETLPQGIQLGTIQFIGGLETIQALRLFGVGLLLLSPPLFDDHFTFLLLFRPRSLPFIPLPLDVLVSQALLFRHLVLTSLDAYLVPNPPVALRIAYFIGGYALIALGVFLLVFAIMNVAAVSLF